MEVFVSDTKTYAVKKDNSEVRLTVRVGDGQAGEQAAGEGLAEEFTGGVIRENRRDAVVDVGGQAPKTVVNVRDAGGGQERRVAEVLWYQGMTRVPQTTRRRGRGVVFGRLMVNTDLRTPETPLNRPPLEPLSGHPVSRKHPKTPRRRSLAC